MQPTMETTPRGMQPEAQRESRPASTEVSQKEPGWKQFNQRNPKFRLGLIPVSYTHLDVYKRQIRTRGVPAVTYWLS